MDYKQLVGEIGSVAAAFDGQDGLLYLQVSRGTELRCHEFPEKSMPNLFMMMKPVSPLKKDRRLQLITFLMYQGLRLGIIRWLTAITIPV